MTARKNLFIALGLALLLSAAAELRGQEPDGGSPFKPDEMGGPATMPSAPVPPADGQAAAEGQAPADGQASTDPYSFRTDPLLCRFAPEWEDFCDRAGGCTWRVDAGTLIMHRADPKAQPLLINSTTSPNTVQFDASDMSYNWAAGPRVSFAVTDCEGWGFELNYFSLDGWSATRDFASGAFPDDGIGILVLDAHSNETLITDAHFELESMLHSSELNARRRLFGNVDALCGFRWVDMFDRYYVRGTSFLSPGDQVSEQVLTHNHLFGTQIGLDGHLGPADRQWYIGGFVKAALMGNVANSRTDLNDPGSFGTASVSDFQTHAAFFGEAGLSGSYRFTEHVAATFGYEVMYIDSVAQPIDQFARTNLETRTTTLDLGTGVFYHGANLGLEVAW